MELYDYSRWENFTKEDLICSFTGLENPNVERFTYFMDRVQTLRDVSGVPFVVTSGYRHETHPDEVNKATTGYHGLAGIDFRVPVDKLYEVWFNAMQLGFSGMGLKAHGPYHKRFIHLDDRPFDKARIWSYP